MPLKAVLASLGVLNHGRTGAPGTADHPAMAEAAEDHSCTAAVLTLPVANLRRSGLSSAYQSVELAVVNKQDTAGHQEIEILRFGEPVSSSEVPTGLAVEILGAGPVFVERLDERILNDVMVLAGDELTDPSGDGPLLRLRDATRTRSSDAPGAPSYVPQPDAYLHAMLGDEAQSGSRSLGADAPSFERGTVRPVAKRMGRGTCFLRADGTLERRPVGTRSCGSVHVEPERESTP